MRGRGECPPRHIYLPFDSSVPLTEDERKTDTGREKKYSHWQAKDEMKPKRERERGREMVNREVARVGWVHLKSLPVERDTTKERDRERKTK